ncbi:Phosphatidylinositol 3- and 4-kinase [Lachnospiraceae bacterium]|nr:Phosphatidylinositol 3- and 4-kinase [Lachnospiraceae bacterium]
MRSVSDGVIGGWPRLVKLLTNDIEEGINMSEKTLIGKRKETYRAAAKRFKSDRDVYNQFRALNSAIPPRKRRAGLTEQELKKMETEYSKTINLLTRKASRIEEEMGGKIELRREVIQRVGNTGRRGNNEKKLLETYDYYIKLRKTLSKDLRAINACIRTDTHPSVAQLYNNSRADKLEMDLSKVAKYGGLLSTRYRIKTPDKDGFFTESKKGITEQKLLDQINEEQSELYGNKSILVRNKYVDVMSLVRIIIRDREGSSSMLFGSWSDGSFRLAYAENERREVLDKMVASIKKAAVKSEKNPNPISQADCDRYCDILGSINSPEEFMSFIDFGNKFGAARNLDSINNNMQINANSKTDKRNSAMTMVADLLGCKSLIANSVNLHIKDPSTGKIIMGTFMENANGADYRGDKPEDMEKFSQLTPSKIEHNLSLKKDIANIQIIDWICGNPDRHTGNMFYKFDDNGRLIGLIGIDNDTSFGSGEHADDLSGIFLENMTVVTQEMADRIEAMDKESLKTMLYGFDLSAAEVNKAIQRFDQLKNKLAADREYFADKPLGYVEKGKIRTVSDEEMNQIPMYGFLGSGNPVNKVEELNNGKKIEYTQGRKTKNLFTAIAMFGINAEGLRASIVNLHKSLNKDCTNVVRENHAMNKRIAQMEAVERETYKGSQVFRDMVASLKTSRNFIKDQKKIYFKQEDNGRFSMDQESVNAAIKELNESLTACNNYLGTKNEAKIMKKSKSSNAYKRFKLAKDAKTAIEKEIKAFSGMAKKVDLANGYIDKKDEIKAVSKAEQDKLLLETRKIRRRLRNQFIQNQNNNIEVQPDKAPVK